MKRALVLLAVSTALAPVLVPATAQARTAPADGARTAKAGSIGIRPGTVVLLPKKSAQVAIRVRVPGLDPDSLVDITARGPRGDLNWATAHDPDRDGVFTATMRFDRMNEAGKWRVETEVYDIGTGGIYAGPAGNLQLKRSTKATANAAPEPVKKGRTLTVGGRLTRLTQYGSPADYVGYKGQRVYVQFMRKGTKKWVSKGYVTTGKDGRYAKRFKAAQDGYWRVQYTGNAQHAPVLSGGDFVDVR